MEQFVLVPISVYNSNIKKNNRCHKEGTTHLSERRQTHVPDWICEERYPWKHFFAKADSLVDKILYSRVILSTSNFLILDGRDAGVSLTDFAHTLKRKNAEVPAMFLVYLMLLILHPAWF